MSARGPASSPARLLGREVGGGAEHRADLRDVDCSAAFGDAEVGELDDAVAAAQQVARLDVAVHDAVAVRVVEAAAGLGEDPDGLVGARGGPRSRSSSAHDWPWTYSMTMKLRCAGLVEAEVEDLHDVGVHEPRGGERLAAEARDEARVLGEVLGQQLDRDLALEPAVERELHGRHAADAEPALELVAAGDELVVSAISPPFLGRRVRGSTPPPSPSSGGASVGAVSCGSGVAVGVGGVVGRRRAVAVSVGVGVASRSASASGVSSAVSQSRSSRRSIRSSATRACSPRAASSTRWGSSATCALACVDRRAGRARSRRRRSAALTGRRCATRVSALLGRDQGGSCPVRIRRPARPARRSARGRMAVTHRLTQAASRRTPTDRTRAARPASPAAGPRGSRPARPRRRTRRAARRRSRRRCRAAARPRAGRRRAAGRRCRGSAATRRSPRSTSSPVAAACRPAASPSGRAERQRDVRVADAATRGAAASKQSSASSVERTYSQTGRAGGVVEADCPRRAVGRRARQEVARLAAIVSCVQCAAIAAPRENSSSEISP